MSRERVLYPQRGTAQAELLIAASIGLCVVLGTLWLQGEPPAERHSDPSVEYGRQLIRDTALNMGPAHETRPCDIPAFHGLRLLSPRHRHPARHAVAVTGCPALSPIFGPRRQRRSQRPHQWLHDAQYERQGTGSGERSDALDGNVYQTAQ